MRKRHQKLINDLEQRGAIWQGAASKTWWFDNLGERMLDAGELRAIADELDRRNTLNTVILPNTVHKINEVV